MRIMRHAAVVLLVVGGCGQSSGPDPRATDSPTGTPDGAAPADAPDQAMPDAGLTATAVATCTPAGIALVEVSIPFPSGARTKKVRPVIDSFGTADPPPGTEFDDIYLPQSGECSVATHDRYWVCGRDGRAYHTWHPVTTTDALTGTPCSFGHEHGDDPRTSRLYAFAGGVPFGIANHAAFVGGDHEREEDNVGHKITVQNDFEVVLGNPPDGLPIAIAGFHCHWLSQLHQGTHSPDAFGHNEHEYQNNLMCDDGAARHPAGGAETHAGADNHTETSVQVLATIGRPNQFEGCDNAETPNVIAYPGEGRAPSSGAGTNREIKCAADQGWVYQSFPKAITGDTGEVDFIGANIAELWKPWLDIVDRSGATIFVASGYYAVVNPGRLYNDKPSLVPKRDLNGDGVVDDYIPTLDVCLAQPTLPMCLGPAGWMPRFSGPASDWWKQRGNPWNGTIRVVEPKSVAVNNLNTREWFCTDYRGVEGALDPVFDASGIASCPDGMLLQRIAPTVNHWLDDHATWGPAHLAGHPGGSSVNAHNGKTVGCGFLHEWVRFYDDEPSVHLPN